MPPAAPVAGRPSAAVRLAAWRQRTLDLLLKIMAALSAASVAVGTPVVWRLYGPGLVIVAWALVALLVLAAVLRRLPYRIRAWVYVGVLLVACFAVVPATGFTISASASGLQAVVLAALLLGPWEASAVATVLLAGIAAVSALPPAALHGYGTAHVLHPVLIAAGILPSVAQNVIGVTIVLRGLERAFDESLSLLRVVEESDRRFRGIFEASPDAVTLNAYPGGQFLDVNPGFERVTGWSRAEVLGRTAVDLGMVRARDRERMQERFEATPAGMVLGVEMVVTRRDGTDAQLMFSGHLANIADQRVIVLVARDVTQERRLAEAVNHAQRVEAMGTLAAGVAHNFRNALGAVLPNIEYCLEDAPEQLRAPLRDARGAAKAAVELAEELTRLSRHEPERANERVDLGEVLRSVAAMCRATFDAGITFQPELADARGVMMGHATQLKQVFLNLCLNARDALTGVPAPRIELAAARSADGRQLTVLVRDNGCGMPAEVLRRVGEPFFTTKGEGRGTGLGLSTAFATVQAAGGRMEVASSPGQGTTFTVALPLADRTAADSAGPAFLPSATGRVLVVDDDTLQLQALGRQLEGLGFTAELFSDPLAALERLRRSPCEFQLLLTDLAMPRLPGTTLAKLARQVAPGLRVVVVTGTAAGPEAAAAGEAWLLKPVATPELAAAVERALRTPANASA